MDRTTVEMLASLPFLVAGQVLIAVLVWLDGATIEMLATLPFLAIGQVLIAIIVWRIAGGPLRPVVLVANRLEERLAILFFVALAWLLVTVTTLWCGYLVAFFAVHALLFWLGSFAAWVGIVVAAMLLLATPVAWGYVAVHEVRVRS